VEYEPNPKHREPWQRGRRGTLCPNLDEAVRRELLEHSDPDGDGPEAKRYAVHEGKAYCAKPHAEGKYHGWPVKWREVPESIWRPWLKSRKVTNRDLKANW